VASSAKVMPSESVGLSADLANALSRETRRRFGRLGYALTALRVLTQARPFHAEIISPEDAVRVKTLQISISTRWNSTASGSSC
jgi:diacylglycerol kinase family enzyme